MRINLRSLTWFVTPLVVAADIALAQDISATVAQFYPVSLEQAAADSGTGPGRRQCYAVLEADASGAPVTIFAAYTDLYEGAVRVLKRSGAGFTVAAEPSQESHSGFDCEVQLLDLNGDGANEVRVSFMAGTNSADWFYAWDGAVLTSMTPLLALPGTEVGETAIRNAGVMDLDGDGVVEVVSFNPSPIDPAELGSPSELYRLNAGRFEIDRPVVSVSAFKRADGAPRDDSVSLRLPAGATGPFTLRVFNGSGLGTGSRVENSVESGRIWLNGQEIVSPQHFGNNVAVIERTVTLQAENELKVRLGGAPGGRIVVVIDAASWTP